MEEVVANSSDSDCRRVCHERGCKAERVKGTPTIKREESAELCEAELCEKAMHAHQFLEGDTLQQERPVVSLRAIREAVVHEDVPQNRRLHPARAAAIAPKPSEAASQ